MRVNHELALDQTRLVRTKFLPLARLCCWRDRVRLLAALMVTSGRRSLSGESRSSAQGPHPVHPAVEWREETEPEMCPNRPPINLAHQRIFHFPPPFFLLVPFYYLSNKLVSFYHFLNLSYALPSSCTSLTSSQESTHYSPLFDEFRVFHNQNLHNIIVCHKQANCSAPYGQIVKWAARKSRIMFIQRPAT